MAKNIMIKAAERIIVKEEAAGAVVITGTDKIASGFGNGDCLLLDFKYQLFALSDSTERYPKASRELLERLSVLIEKEGVPEDRDEWLNCINVVLSMQLYHQKTTFSSVALRPDAEGTTVYVIQGGDSMIFIVNGDSGAIEYQTKPDMNFAGRTKSFTAIDEHHIGAGNYRILLCSDGFSDIARLLGKSVEDVAVCIATRYQVHDIPERVREMVDTCEIKCAKRDYDDISLVILDPAKVAGNGELRVIMGGTSAYEEEIYQNKVLPDRIINKWLGVEEISSHVNLMDSCGIRVL